MENIGRAFVIISLITMNISCEKEDNCDTPNACQLNPDPGPCLAYIPKYYYDRQAEECKEFIWGGCEGVVPFDSIQECRICECNDN